MSKEINYALLFSISLFISIGCNQNENKIPAKQILTQETIDSLMKSYKPQSATYKGVVANIGAREYNFEFDSGKHISLMLQTKSPDLRMQIFEEKLTGVTKDSITTYFRKFELIADTISWNRKMTQKTNFKIKLQLSGESAKSKNLVPFEMKIVK